MKSILVIEDSLDTLEVMQLLLTKEGFNVLMASDGLQGMKLFESNPIDLVITDMFMPGPSGFEVIKTLREKHPDVKIIAISGEFLPKSDENQNLADMLGVIRTFSKPFDLQELVDFIKATLPEG